MLMAQSGFEIIINDQVTRIDAYRFRSMILRLTIPLVLVLARCIIDRVRSAIVRRVNARSCVSRVRQARASSGSFLYFSRGDSKFELLFVATRIDHRSADARARVSLEFKREKGNTHTSDADDEICSQFVSAGRFIFSRTWGRARG